MNKFKSWLMKTFTGIYGIDNLYFVLFGLTMLLIIVNIFVRFWGIWILEALLIAYMLFRAMSHNITARRRENNAVFGFFKRIGNFFKLQKNRFRDRKTHVYKKCPDCKAVLRLPKSKGTHTAVCPRCKGKFTVK